MFQSFNNKVMQKTLPIIALGLMMASPSWAFQASTSGGKGLDYEGAANYCASQHLRLPTVKEAVQIVNPNSIVPATQDQCYSSGNAWVYGRSPFCYNRSGYSSSNDQSGLEGFGIWTSSGAPAADPTSVELHYLVLGGSGYIYGGSGGDDLQKGNLRATLCVQ